MKPLSEEEQKVLDNAPAGAEFYVTLCQLPYGYYARKKVKYGMSAEYIGINGSFSCSVFDCRISSTIKLADLRARKEQSEKKTVRDAVDFFKGESLDIRTQDSDENLVLFCLEDGDGCEGDKGDFVYGYTGFCKTARVKVCTVERYNQCTIDLTGPTAEFDTWSLELKFDRARDQYKHDELDAVQDSVADKKLMYTQAMKDSGDLPSVGMECMVFGNHLHNASWEKCSVLFIGEFTVVYNSESCNERSSNLDNVKFKPIETPEQKKLRELNIAKELQIEEYATKMWLVEGYKSDHIELLNRMQAEGMLAEIKLPE